MARARTPTILQMEAAECGAASLAMILGHFRRFVGLEDLRARCGVDRNGANAANILKAARSYGLAAKGLRRPAEAALAGPFPAIVFWDYNHFLVLEGARGKTVFLNDPAHGPREMTREDFSRHYSGVMLVFETGEGFAAGGRPPAFWPRVREMARGLGEPAVLVVLYALVLAVAGLAVPGMIKTFIDGVLVLRSPGWAGPIVLGLAVAVLVQAGVSLLTQSLTLRVHMALLRGRTLGFVEHLLRLPVAFFASRHTGDLVSRTGSVETAARLVSRDLSGVGLDGLAAVFLFALMLAYSPLLTAIALLMVLVNLGVLHMVRRRRTDLALRLQTEAAKLFSATVTGVATIETIKAGGNETGAFAKWAGHHARALEAEQRSALFEQGFAVLTPLTTAIAAACVLLAGSVEVMAGSLTVGGLVAFQALMGAFSAHASHLVETGSSLQAARADFARLADVEAARQDWRYATPAATGERARGRLDIDDVAFAYGPLDPPFIADFSLSLEPGRSVALVGHSGSGKSTIGSLVCGLYLPKAGSIRLDGRPLADWPRADLSHALARVDQDIRLFSGTLRDNITLWDEEIPLADVRRAMQDAGLGDFSPDMPLTEGGRNLSGGQRQRVEIARALVRNPALLVLDEATSALDAVSEEQVMAAVRARGLTLIVVAHRLSTVRDCDEILVLDHGRIVERGSHADLLATGGAYARLVREI